MAAININVGANTRQAERDIQKLVNRNYNINLSTRGGAPLGRITGQVNEFTKSLDASNARVIAFGASAGIIFGVQRAFGALVTSVIETQKSLADINVILNVSTQNLQKFGGELFNIAKNTGQSFQEVAKAATEFSRQGLGVEETLKRTNEALILSRLSGLDAAKSVEALTAAVNSYASQAVTASEVVNKFANVDAAFAVSSADLAEALARVGSSAAQSGVDLNELIAIVTSAQQTTARGGAVIGNSFKTIFTRLQRGSVINLLDNLGVNTKDSSGEIKSTIDLLTDLARVYDQLGTLQQAEVAEKVGGVFQINILKAALADLGKEYSIYNSALQVAGSTTDQAIRRNAELNKTYAAQLNALRENAQQLSAGVGERVLGPAFDRVVGNANTLLGGINESDGQGVGATLGKGILDGLGQVIAGPGLALIGGVFIKLFADLSKFAGGSLKELLNLNSASKQQQALQQSVNQILQKNPDLFKLMSSGTAGLNKGAEILLNSLRAQTLELQKQQALSAQIAAQFIRTGGVRVVDGVPTAPTPGKAGKAGKASGFIPNFAATGGVSKRDAFAETIAAYQAGYEPKGVGKVDGKVYNKAESVVQFPGAKDRGIVPPKDSPAGKQYQKDFKKTAGYDPYGYMEKGMSKGFVPNFALNFPKSTYKPSDENIKKGLIGESKTTEELQKRVASGQLGSFRQESSKDPFASFDFTAKLPNGEQLLIDAKNFQKFGKSKYLGEVTKKLWNYRQFADLQTQTLDYSNTPVEIYIPKTTFDKSKSLRGLPKEKMFNEPLNKLRVPGIQKYGDKDRMKFRSSIKTFADGFIPNFAKIIDLGDTVTAPQLKGKVSSLIHPKETGGQEKRGVTANYLGQQYKGLVTTAGINRAEIENTVPDLEKNLGRILVDEANQFGQAIGGQNFLKSPDELPNYGAVKGAVGNAFEGGVTTLLQRNLQKSSQTAGIDFTQKRMTAKMKRLFHGAPGTYEAKYSPDLANEVLGKMLKAANVGGVKQARSGTGYKATQDLRTAARENLKGQNLRRGPQLNKAIEVEMAKIKRERGMAAGYIPNFAAEAAAKKREMSRAGSAVTLYSDMLGSSVVVNKPQIAKYGPNADKIIKKDHIDRGQVGTKSNLMKTGSGKEKYKARGFIPNFAAEDSAPTDIGSSIGALAAQLSGLAFMLSFNRGQYKTALEGLTKSTKQAAKEQLKATREQIRRTYTYQTGPGGFVLGGGDPFKARDEASKKFRQQSSPFTAKAGAAIGSNALSISLLGPILAETIANAIGTEDKTGRVASSGASALGQAATFAGFGALLTPAIPLLGAGIGAAAGGLLGLVDVIKQASTDIPELSAAAEKASQNLTKINDAGQKVQTSFEQIQGLRESGQGEKAGVAETELIRFIRRSFQDTPEFSGQLQTAVINQDAKSLQDALGENTKAILENSISQERNLLIGKFLENIGGKDSSKQLQNIIGLENLELGDLNKLTDVSTRAKTTDPGPIGFATQEANKLIDEFFDSLNLATAEADALKTAFKFNPGDALDAIAGLSEPAKNMLEAMEAAARNTTEVTKIIAFNLKAVQSNYAKLAKQSQSALDLQLLGESVGRTSGTRIKADNLKRDAEVDTLFGVSTPRGKADKGTLAALEEIEGTFSSSVQDSIGSGLSLIGGGLIAQLESSLKTLQSFGTGSDTQKNALANMQATKDLLNTLKNPKTGRLDETFIEKFRKILDVGNIAEFQGFDVEKKLEEIAKELNITGKDEEGQKRLDLIREALNKTNSELVKNKAVLIEQKTILANQKFTAKLTELVNTITSSFGGIQNFITDDASPLSSLEDAIANIQFMGEPAGERSLIDSGRNFQAILSELSTILGKNIGPTLGAESQIIKDITGARSLDIQNQLENLFNSLGGIEGQKGRELISAVRQTLASDLGQDTSRLSLEELFKLFANRKAEVEVGTENKVGEVNKQIYEQARMDVPESLRPYLDGINSADLPSSALIQIQFNTANNTLEQILAEIRKAESNIFVPNPKIDQLAPKQNLQDSLFPKTYMSLAAGSIPSEAIPAMMAESRDIANGVGGALPTDRPEILRNFNGKTVVGGSGETVEKNFMGTGKSAILTREMQDAMATLSKKPMRNNKSMGFIPNFAEGYIPSEAIIQKIIRESNFDPDKLPEIAEWLKLQGLSVSSEKEYLNEIENWKAGKAGVFQEAFSNKVLDKKLKRINDLKRLVADPNTHIGDRQTAQEMLDKMLAKISEELPKTETATKDASKAAGKGAGKAAGKAAGAAGAAGKGVAKGIGKGILKQIPVAGTLLGLGFAAYRLAQGDYIGAGLEASSTIPGLGIGSSAALIAYDMQKENESVSEQSYGNQQTTQAQQQNQKELLAEQPNVRREATKRREAKKVKPSVNMPVIPTPLDFANAATRNLQQTQLNKQITTARTAKPAKPVKPTNPYGLIGGKGNAPATQIDRRTGTGTTVPKAESVKTSQPNAKFIMESLVEAYTKSLSNQEGFYNRPTRETMDQKRALMAKVNEFKGLYEQGKYESLKTIYNKHQKSDPVKDAYASYKAKGIDPNAGYDAAMRAVGLNPETGAPDYSPVSQGSRIDGRPAEEVLAEGRANRPSDPAYDAAMTAAGLDPRSGSPLNAQQTSYPVGPGGAGLIDGRPAQEVLEEGRARIQNLSKGYLPALDMARNKEKLETGLDDRDIYSKKFPELRSLKNMEGDGIFNRIQEGSSALERQAINQTKQIPNFANPSSSQNSSINIGPISLNLSTNLSSESSSEEYGAEFSAKLEARLAEVSNSIKEELDQKYGRASETITNMMNSNQNNLGRFAPPPKTRGYA